MPKPNTTRGGCPAVETETVGGAWCASLPSSETITVLIPRDTSDNWYPVDACLRAPGLSQTKR